MGSEPAQDAAPVPVQQLEGCAVTSLDVGPCRSPHGCLQSWALEGAGLVVWVPQAPPNVWLGHVRPILR